MLSTVSHLSRAAVLWTTLISLVSSAEPPTAAEITAAAGITHAVIHTPRGDIHVRLFPTTAPISVANFAKLARAGFFDGLTFHRVVPGFVIQGGDPGTRIGAPADGLPIGNGSAGYQIPPEIGPGNPEKHSPGTLAMADSGLGTASSQFYLTMAAAPHLDGRYTVFGRVSGPEDLQVIRLVQPNDRFTVEIDK